VVRAAAANLECGKEIMLLLCNRQGELAQGTEDLERNLRSGKEIMSLLSNHKPTGGGEHKINGRKRRFSEMEKQPDIIIDHTE
jgi:hypothetical protein